MKSTPYYNSATDQSPYETSIDAKHTLGEVMWYYDKKFVYCKNGSTGTISAGRLCSHLDGNAETLGHTSSTILAAAIGDTTIVIKNKTSITANEFANGYFGVTNTQGEGHMYQIVSHDASGATGASNRLTLTLREPIRIATVGGSSRGNLVDNPCVVQQVNAASTAYEKVIGIPLVDVTTMYYFWAQVSGPCLLRAGAGSIAEGAPIGPAINTTGNARSIRSQSMHLCAQIGQGMIAARTSTEWGWVYLNIQ